MNVVFKRRIGGRNKLRSQMTYLIHIIPDEQVWCRTLNTVYNQMETIQISNIPSYLVLVKSKAFSPPLANGRVYKVYPGRSAC